MFTALSGRIGRLFQRGVRVEMVVGDITTIPADVIVNAAKSSLLGGGGVDGAIHRAGGPAILRECEAIRADQHPNGLPSGQAVATTAGRLPADWVIHTVGPIYSPTLDRSQKLRNCYTNTLVLADALDAQTVSFPLISAGVYGWPKDDALLQAMIAIRSTPTRVKTVRIVFFDQATFRAALGR